MVHVPFKEMSQLFSAVAGNDVAWSFGSAASAGPLYKAGKVKFMAVAAPKRIAGYESIPTVAEAGGPADFEVKAWVALFAPAGTPAPVVTRIQQDVALALTEPDVKEKLAGVGFEPYTVTTAEIRKLMEADIVAILMRDRQARESPSSNSPCHPERCEGSPSEVRDRLPRIKRPRTIPRRPCRRRCTSSRRRT